MSSSLLIVISCHASGHVPVISLTVYLYIPNGSIGCWVSDPCLKVPNGIGLGGTVPDKTMIHLNRPHNNGAEFRSHVVKLSEHIVFIVGFPASGACITSITTLFWELFEQELLSVIFIRVYWFDPIFGNISIGKFVVTSFPDAFKVTLFDIPLGSIKFTL